MGSVYWHKQTGRVDLYSSDGLLRATYQDFECFWYKVNGAVISNKKHIKNPKLITVKDKRLTYLHLLKIVFFYGELPDFVRTEFTVYHKRRKFEAKAQVSFSISLFEFYWWLEKTKPTWEQHEAKIYFGKQRLDIDYRVLLETHTTQNHQYKKGKSLFKRVLDQRKQAGYFPFSQESDNGETDFGLE